jgi:hypothetical protein
VDTETFAFGIAVGILVGIVIMAIRNAIQHHREHQHQLAMMEQTQRVMLAAQGKAFVAGKEK